MATINLPVQHKRSVVAGKIPLPQDLLEGEIGINLYDRKIYTKDSAGTIFQIGVVSSDFQSVAFSGSYNDLIDKPDIQGAYVLPNASNSTLGGIKVGTGLNIDINGVLSNFITSIKGSAGTSQTGDVIISPADLGLDILGSNGKIEAQYLPSAISGAIDYRGTWDANANNPVIPVASADNKGWYYIVSVAGNTDINGISNWVITDQLVSDGVEWSKISGQPTTVVSLNGMTGIVSLDATNLPGLATVGRTGNYSDLLQIPTTFTPASHTQDISTITNASLVAKTGEYSDLLGLPANPNIKNIGVNVNGNPVIYSVTYIFTQAISFSQDFANSKAFFTLLSGTATSVSIKKANSGTTSFVEVGTITYSSTGVTFTTSNPSSLTFAVGDILRYDWNNTNISTASITLQGILQ